MRRVLGDSAAVHLWLALTLAGLAATVVAGNAAWAVAGWALGGVAAVIVAAIIVAAAKTWRPPRAPGSSAGWPVPHPRQKPSPTTDAAPR